MNGLILPLVLSVASPIGQAMDHQMMMPPPPPPQSAHEAAGQQGATGTASTHGMATGGMASMAHGTMAMPQPQAPVVETPPPASAGTGPARAADAIWGADAMQASRHALGHGMGGQQFLWVMVDRAEYRAGRGGDGYLWDAQASYGGDLDKLWFKSEGEGTFGEKAEQAELQALYSHAITPWFDLQGGVRHDFARGHRTDAVIGIQGMAPYRFDVGAAAFLSTRGELRARIDAALDQRITQRLILQPRAELNLAAQDMRDAGVGAGLDRVELGLRLRYEIRREFAPYIGIAQEWRTGRSADFARARGDHAATTGFVAGVRLWF
ncbi:MAG: copper resistance protein B [Sphingomonas sp.]